MNQLRVERLERLERLERPRLRPALASPALLPAPPPSAASPRPSSVLSSCPYPVRRAAPQCRPAASSGGHVGNDVLAEYGWGAH
eukprot:scaffold164153_cov29-Tisochrysis_lutea.AAC.4